MTLQLSVPSVKDARATAAILLIALVATGCITRHEERVPTSAKGQGAPTNRQPPTNEVWYAVYIGDAKQGHAHLTVTPVREEGQNFVRHEMEQTLSIVRDGQPVNQNVMLKTLETTEGQLLEVESQLSGAGSSQETTGRSSGTKFEITFNTPGSSKQSAIAWDSSWRGFFADQQTLWEKPMQPGESRTLHGLLPLLNVVGKLELQAKSWEEVDTRFGKEKLLRIELTTTFEGGPQLDTVMWTDEKGQARKTWNKQGNITTCQTVKEIALAPNDAMDLYDLIQVHVQRPMPDPHHTKRAVYRARLKSGTDPQSVFFQGLSQHLTKVDEQTVEIEVRVILPDNPPEVDVPQTPPQPADQAPNGIVQSDDARVQAMSDEVAPEISDPWQWALACEQYVHRSIEKKVLTVAFSTAAEVAQTRQGDCTEHAVLLAALCRNHGIPARVSTGLVAYKDIYAFHMWNEVWIRDRWVSLDSTLAQGGIGAGHLKLTDTNLEGVTPFVALAPVLQVFGDLELEVVRFE